MRGLHAVLDEKLGSGVAEPGCFDHPADGSGEAAVALAEVEAGGLHLAGLRFEVAPIWSDNHWRKGSSKILHPPRSESGLQAEKLPRRMWRRIVSLCAPVSSAAWRTVIVPFISTPPVLQPYFLSAPVARWRVPLLDSAELLPRHFQRGFSHSPRPRKAGLWRPLCASCFAWLARLPILPILAKQLVDHPISKCDFFVDIRMGTRFAVEKIFSQFY